MHNFILDSILKGEIISAGFVEFEDGHFICHGYSQSIRLGGLKDDSKVLNKQFNIKKGMTSNDLQMEFEEK